MATCPKPLHLLKSMTSTLSLLKSSRPGGGSCVTGVLIHLEVVGDHRGRLARCLALADGLLDPERHGTQAQLREANLTQVYIYSII